MPAFFSRPFLSQNFFTDSEPNACGDFLRDCFSRRKSIVSTIPSSAFLCVVLCLLALCWSPGHLNIKETEKIGL